MIPYKDLFNIVYTQANVNVSDVNVAVQDDYSVDLPNIKPTVKDYIQNELYQYTLTELGLTANTLNANITTSVFSPILVNLETSANISNTKILCILNEDQLNITGTVYLKNWYD